MNKLCKSIIAGSFVFFLLPFALGVCCCLDDVFASISPVVNHHDHQHAASSHDHGDHDGGECEHDQIQSNIPNNIFLSSQIPIAFDLIKSHVSELISFSHFTTQTNFFDTGPPGRLFPTTPLYLQLSVLRI